MVLPARVWTAGKVLLLVGALATTFVVFAVLAARVAVRARDVSVPNLIGRTLADATATATAYELQLNVEETRRPDPRVPAEHVLGQEPPAGSSARTLEAIEMEHILRVLDKHGGSKQPAAAELGISLKTLYNKLNKLEEKKNAG